MLDAATDLRNTLPKNKNIRGRASATRADPAARGKETPHASQFLIAGVLLALAPPISAAPAPEARLVRCGDHDCLRVSGQREDARVLVIVNSHETSPRGARKWRVDLPLDTLRRLAPLHARTVEVTLHDPDTGDETSASVRLPIGLLGGTTRLTALEVTGS